MTSGPVRSEARFAVTVALACLALGLVKAALHEPWRDELNPWLIARHTASFAEAQAVYDTGGHPRLWHTLLWLTSRVTGDFMVWQALQAVFAAAGAWVFLRFAPFGRALRVLFVLGYFPAFEYGVIARPYGLGLALALAATAVLARRPGAVLSLALLLALLAQTTVFGGIAAGALALAWWWDDRTGRADDRQPLPGTLCRPVTTATIAAPQAIVSEAEFRCALWHAACMTNGIFWGLPCRPFPPPPAVPRCWRGPAPPEVHRGGPAPPPPRGGQTRGPAGSRPGPHG